MTKYLMLIALVASLSKTSWAIESSCDYYQYVSPGTRYYVYNPGYPAAYSGSRSCRWYAQSDTSIKLSCQQFSLPATQNCAGDRLSISPSGDYQLSDAHNYCGTGTFNLTSDGNNMNIVFTSFAGSGGGKFLCSLEATADTSPTCNCGWKKQMRIVGGTSTAVNEYPSMAGVVNLEQRMLYCGATIISPKHVLTAAHCAKVATPDRLAILVGDHDTTTGAETSSSSIHLVSQYVIHPLYDANTQANDIAVMTVKDTIIYTMEVGPACLPFKYAAASFEGTKVTALGWGTLEFAGATSPTLQKVQLDVTPLTRCQSEFPGVTRRQMCTYTPGKDACQFDSGGPLLWQNPETMRLVLAGIISYGQVCADTTSGVNTRVGAYVDWIVSVTPGANYCRIE